MGTISSITSTVPSAGESIKTAAEMNTTSWYVLAGIISFLILLYLLYALIKPERF